VREEIKNNAAMDNSEKTVFHSLLMDSNVPESDNTDHRMAEEARILLLGGTDTTAMALSAITYHILANPSIFKKLKAELTQAIPDPDSLPVASQIEALPYLTAIIEEGLRLHSSASGRQERVAPDEDLIYQDTKRGRRYVIPKGVSDPSFAGKLLVQNQLISLRPL
jgi:cytochrome P450